MLHVTVLAMHRGAMLAALLAFLAAELLLLLARCGARAPAAIAVRAGGAGNLIAGLGLAAGVVLLVLGGWSPLTPWLVASFGLIGTLMAVRGRLVRPWEARLLSLLESGASSATVQACAADRPALIGRVAVIALFCLIAGLMATKPDLMPALSRLS
jgi:hypothetical protein